MTLRSLLMIAAVTASCAFGQQMVPNSKDKGVARGTLVMNEAAGVEVLRVEIQPGMTRSIHQHDDVKYHLFLPISGSIELTIAGVKTAATGGQAYFIEKGTPHGFRNTGSTPAAAFEVFIREPKAAASHGDAGKAAGDALALAMALTVAGR